MDKDHLLQCQAISKINSDINPQLSVTGMQEGDWKTFQEWEP